VTVTNNVAALYLSATSACTGSAAEAAAKRNEDKYAEISSNYHFFPLAFETFGPINQVGSDFCVRWVNDSPSFLMTLVKLLFSFNVFCFYSALQFCLFLQLIWKPASTIFGPAMKHLEFYSFLDNFSAFGNQVPRTIK